MVTLLNWTLILEWDDITSLVVKNDTKNTHVTLNLDCVLKICTPFVHLGGAMWSLERKGFFTLTSYVSHPGFNFETWNDNLICNCRPYEIISNPFEQTIKNTQWIGSPHERTKYLCLIRCFTFKGHVYLRDVWLVVNLRTDNKKIRVEGDWITSSKMCQPF